MRKLAPPFFFGFVCLFLEEEVCLGLAVVELDGIIDFTLKLQFHSMPFHTSVMEMQINSHSHH